MIYGYELVDRLFTNNNDDKSKNKKDSELKLSAGLKLTGAAITLPGLVKKIEEMSIDASKNNPAKKKAEQDASEFIDRYNKSKLKKSNESIIQDIDINSKSKRLRDEHSCYNKDRSGTEAHVKKTSSEAVIAHELGHGKIDQGKPAKAIARALLKAGSKPAGLITGAVTGYKAGKKESNDENYKESNLSKYSGALISTAMKSPTLINEFRASKKGLNIMKELGYDKNAISKGKNRLIKAGLTYVGSTLGAAGTSQALHYGGKKLAKWIKEGKEKENDKKN